ncbi:MAG: serine/threonine-protein kinase [Phycisphaerales bacterium]|nr:serine/threonine-protein kinase [Phycisphaerales bacterium]
MSTDHPPTDPDAETIGMPSDDSGKGSMPEPSKVPSVGMPSEIGRYKILGVIGSGGMGHVYEAMQEAPRRRVALKVIRSGAASEMALRRFQFETQILAKLHHPNIAQIYEAGTWESPEGDVPFFAMEYIPGRLGIIQYVQKRNLSTRDRLELFSKVCDAVHHGHQKGIIHRDLKPDNILIDSNGEPKIIDFGVARATDADLAVTTMQTTMGQLIGTLQYMSPEQCDADPDQIDTRSDVYALGVILFQLLSGKLPYDLRRQAIHEAIRVIKEQRPSSMATISGTLKGDVDTIAMKAMEKDRERRYQSAAELANDISHFLNSEPIEARPLSIVYQLRLFTKKYKRSCVAIIALVLTIILGIMGTSWGMIEANKQKAIAIEQRDVAEKRADDILKMSQESVTTIYNGIKKVNAAIEVRLEVLDSALQHFHKLASSTGETPEIRASIAFTEGRLGKIYASTQGAYLGNPVEALKHYNNSLDIYQALVEDGHDIYKNKYSAVLALTRISKVYKMTDQVSLEEETLETAKNLIDQLSDEQPSSPEVARLRSNIYMSIGDRFYYLDQIDEAIDIYKTVAAQRTIAAKRFPNDLAIKRSLANILQRIAMTFVDKEDLESGLEKYVEADKYFTELATAEPTNGRAKRDLGYSSYYVGRTLVGMDQHDEGMKFVENGLRIFQTRCAEFPNAEDARNDLASYLKIMIKLRGVIGQEDKALDDCRQTLLILQPVVEKNPDNLALGIVYQQIQLMMGDLQKNSSSVGIISE